MKRELEHIEIPNEHEARERTWHLVSSAFGERDAAPLRRRDDSSPALAVVAVGAIVAAAAVTSPGRALVHSIRKTIGVQNAKPALFSLPASGRLLVTSGAGVWVVQADGSKRLLGRYVEASWSPHGRFVVATRRNALYALTPAGEERWSLARPDVGLPRWTGTTTDTRIAYLTTSRLHVVGGDGRGDLDAGGLAGGLSSSGTCRSRVAARREARAGIREHQGPRLGRRPGRRLRLLGDPARSLCALQRATKARVVE